MPSFVTAVGGVELGLIGLLWRPGSAPCTMNSVGGNPGVLAPPVLGTKERPCPFYPCRGPESRPALKFTDVVNLYIRCVFWGISPNRRTLGCYDGGAFPILYVPMEICLLYKRRKKGGNFKRVVFVREGPSTCAFSWGLGTPSGSCPCVPLPQRDRNRTGTSPTTTRNKASWNWFLPVSTPYYSIITNNN